MRTLLVCMVVLMGGGARAEVILNSFEPSTSFYYWARSWPSAAQCAPVSICFTAGPCATVYQDALADEGAVSGKVYLQGTFDTDCDAKDCAGFRTLTLANFSPKDWSSGFGELVLSVREASGGQPNYGVALRVKDTLGVEGTVSYTITSTGDWYDVKYEIVDMLNDGIDLSSISLIAVDMNPVSQCTTLFIDYLRLVDCASLPADLTVSKVQIPAGPVPGGAVTYRIVAANKGITAITRLTLVDTISPIITGVATDQSPDFGAPTVEQSGSGTRYIWSGVGLNLLPGEAYTFTLTGTVGRVCVDAWVSNTAHVRAAAGCSGTSLVAASAGFNVPAEAGIDVVVSKIQSPGSPSAGSPVTYGIVVTNRGTVDVDTVTVVDTVSPVVINQNADQPVGFGPPTVTDQASGTRYEWSASGINMAPGASYTFTITGFVGGVCVNTAVGNTALVAAGGMCSATRLMCNASGFTAIGVPAIAFTATKTQQPAAPGVGDTVTYRLVVANTGGGVIQRMNVVDTVSPVVAVSKIEQPSVFGPPVVSQQAGGTRYVWSSASLSMAPGTTYTFTITGTVSLVCAGASVSNTAWVKAGGACVVQQKVTNPVGFSLPAPPPLAIATSKVQSPVLPGIGDTVTYRIVVTNTGGATVDDLTVVDTVSYLLDAITVDQPAAMAPVATVQAGTDTRFTWSSLSAGLLPGSAYTFTITGTVASVCAVEYVSNTAYVGAIVPCAKAEVLTNATGFKIEGVPPLGIVVLKQQSPVSPGPGDTVTYRIVVTNTGGATVDDLTVIDTVSYLLDAITVDQPAAMAPVATVQAGTDTRFTWSSLSAGLLPGSAYTFTITGTVASVCTVEYVSNTAYVGASTACEKAEKLTNLVGFKIYVAPPLGITVSKQQVPAAPIQGDTVVYRIMVTNSGAATIPVVKVTDTVSAIIWAQSVDQPVAFGLTVSDVPGGTMYVWSGSALSMLPGVTYTFTIAGTVGAVCGTVSESNRALAEAVVACDSKSILSGAVGYDLEPFWQGAPGLDMDPASSEVVLGWDPARPGAVIDPVNRYMIFRSTQPVDCLPAVTAGTVYDGGASTRFSFTDTGLMGDTTYFYSVMAITQDGCFGFLGGALNRCWQVFTTADCYFVGPPSVAALPTSNVVNWQAGTSGSMSGFEVWRGDSSTGDSSGKILIASLPANARSYEDSDLLTETMYCYAVLMRADPSCSVFSAEVCSQTLAFTAYPNPARLSAGPVRFDGLPEGATIEIYTFNGELVRKYTSLAGGLWLWDGRNESGSMVASGIYFYMMRGSGSTARGKLVIAR